MIRENLKFSTNLHQALCQKVVGGGGGETPNYIKSILNYLFSQIAFHNSDSFKSYGVERGAVMVHPVYLLIWIVYTCERLIMFSNWYFFYLIYADTPFI